MSLRRLTGTLVLGVVLAVAVARPAAAHPFFQDGGEVPARSLATVTLDLAHGCTPDGHDTGDELDTTEVAMEVPEAMTFVEPHPAEGWTVDTETDGDRVAVVTWSEDGGAEPAPTFDLDVVVDGEEGDEVHVRVVQACGDEFSRWIGTPDEPADEPAVRLRLTAPDPDSPPPPEEESATEAEEDATDEPVPEEPAADEPAEEPADEPAEEPTEEPAAAPAAGEGPNVVLPVALGLVLLLAGAALLVWLRRRRAAGA